MLPPSWARHLSRCLAALAFTLGGAVILPAQEGAVRTELRPTDRLDPPAGNGPTDLLRYTSPSTSHYYFSLPVAEAVPLLFFPPNLPILGTPIPLRSPLDNGVAPPAELAAHVGDLFYPQLASRLAADELPRRLRVKLDSYRQLRHSLLDELEAGIAAARDLPREARRAALADGAGRQTVRLQELEAAAEQLRSELVGPRVAETRTSQREGPANERSSVSPNPWILRAAAFYAEGLSLRQRRLLLTASAEIELGVAANTTVFFSPEGAGIRLPTPLARPVAEALAAYADARRALVHELLAAFERPTDDPARWRDLVARQAPAFAALEAQADKLRTALQETNAGMDDLPSSPSLPADLAGRLAAYRDRKQALLVEFNASLTSTVRAAATSAPDRVVVPVSAFTGDQQIRLAALNREKDAIRAALVEHRRASGSTQDRKSVDNLLEDFDRARQAQELREKYAAYRIALLEPGLSPAQRRLLLDSALQRLALPLPSGEPLLAP